MRKVLMAFVALTLSAGVFALPLTVVVMKESEKIADSIRAFNKKCAGLGDTATEQQEKECDEKHTAIAEALAKFVILAHQELDFLPEDPAKFRAQLQKQQSELSDSQKAEIVKQLGAQALDIEAEVKHAADRRRDMQLHIHWAQYWINCLGREDVAECKAERTKLDEEVYPFGRVGLMSDKPTHEGEEEAKHWHAVKINPSELHPIPEKTAPESSNEGIETFIQAFVRDMASNDATLLMRYYNNPCRYYDQGNTSLVAIRKEIERDIRAWKKRAYSVHTQPVVRKTEPFQYRATFEMAYTLEDPKPRSSGILAMSLSLKQDNGTLLITDIQKRVISAHKR